MAYIKPDEVVAKMIETAVAKGQLPAKDLLIRESLSGALLGFAPRHDASRSLGRRQRLGKETH